ncbi:MAG: hypothetical protein JOY79_10340 [Acidobacteriaceae bacterium]|nr:hypothetical protein [Acidobacteriaceae bacterium]
MAERALSTENTHDIAATAGVPETATEPERLLPQRTQASTHQDARWNNAAGEFGRRAGRAVAVVREFPQRARELPRRIEDARWQMRDRLRVIRQQSPGESRNRIDELRESAASRIGTLRNRAQERLQLLRNRADRIQREHPIELIVGAFGAAFLLGVGLRIWRSNSD